MAEKEDRLYRAGPITLALYERVTWEWQPLEPLVQEVMKLVPPGPGIRHYNAKRESYERGRGAEAQHIGKELPEWKKRQSGQRAKAMAAVRTLAAEDAPYAELRQMVGEDGKVIKNPATGKATYEIRRKERRQPQKLRPGVPCPTCGTLAGTKPTQQEDKEPEQAPRRFKSDEDIRRETFKEAAELIAVERRHINTHQRGVISTFTEGPLSNVERLLRERAGENL